MRVLVPVASLLLLAPLALALPGTAAATAATPLPDIFDVPPELVESARAQAQRLRADVEGRPQNALHHEAWASTPPLRSPPPDGPAVPTIQSGLGPGSALWMIEEVGGDSGGICTAAFILRDPRTATYYLATAGHCLVKDPNDAKPYRGPQDAKHLMSEIHVCVSGCMMNALGIGQYVTIPAAGAFHPVTFAQSGGVGLDFGIVELPTSVHKDMRPWMPQWGGPTGYDPSSAGNQLVHYGHGSYCCPLFGAVASRTSADQGRAGFSLGNDGESFTAIGDSSGGDSGSAVNRAAPSATRGVQGTEAIGVLTHGLIVPGVPLFWGTTLEKGLAMVKQGTGLDLELVLQDDTLSTTPTVQYTLAIQAPSSGARIQVPADVTVRGTAAGSDGTLPGGARVVLSLDDPAFAKPRDAQGTSEWSLTWRVEGKGSHTLRARLVDADGDVLAEASVSFQGDAPGSSGGKPRPTTSKAPTGGDGGDDGAGEDEWIEETDEGSEPVSPKGRNPKKSSPAPALAILVALVALATSLGRRRLDG